MAWLECATSSTNTLNWDADGLMVFRARDLRRHAADDRCRTRTSTPCRPTLPPPAGGAPAPQTHGGGVDSVRELLPRGEYAVMKPVSSDPAGNLQGEHRTAYHGGGGGLSQRALLRGRCSNQTRVVWTLPQHCRAPCTARHREWEGASQ